MPTNILIVEDEHLVAMDIQMCLTSLGFAAPVLLDSGEDAIAYAGETKPDLVLMDIRLAGALDGVEAANAIRVKYDIPVIYLTAQIDKQTLERAKATGPFGYVLKPFDERDLHTTIEMALAKHNMERRLRESEERMRGVFENALDAVITMDAAGTITEWNPHAERTFGWTRQEALGQDLAEMIIPHAYREDHRRGLKKFLATGAGPLLNRRLDQLTALHRSGREFPIEISISPAKYGESYSFSAYIRDITERRQARERLEKSEQKYRRLVETTQTGYVIIDEAGNVIDANAEYVRLSGHLTLQDIVDRNVLEWTTEEGCERSRQEIKQCIERGLMRGFEKQYIDSHGVVTPIEINATVIDTEDGPRILGLCRDITERHEAEQALKQSNADLEEYAHVVSHDLKEPLGVIMRHVQSLEKRYADELDERARAHIVKTIEGAKYMERLINDLKRNAEIGRGSVEPVDCRRILASILDHLQPVIAEVGAVVNSDPLPMVRANQSEVAQIFQNLLANSIKFRSSERSPIIHIGCERDAGMWRLWVRDNGIGIAANHQSRIFQIFERIGEIETDGTGIGLANCKKAVERRGGEIWVESEFGEGSTFYFTLPDVREEE